MLMKILRNCITGYNRGQDWMWLNTGNTKSISRLDLFQIPLLRYTIMSPNPTGSFSMRTTSVSKGFLASCFCYYLAGAPAIAVATVESPDRPAPLLVRDYQAPDVGVGQYQQLPRSSLTSTLGY